MYFTSKHILPENTSKASRFRLSRRDEMYNRFKTQVGLLMESKKPKKISTNRGLLNNRTCYKFPFSDNIFQQITRSKKGDTSIVFLIDGSGSMDGNVYWGDDGNITRMEQCGIVASAFAKAVRDVLNNEIKIEVFVKSAPGCGTVGEDKYSGSFVTVARVFTNTKPFSNSDLDALVNIQPHCPFELTTEGEQGRALGSYTAEYSILPGLTRWMRMNIQTKNTIVLNLTDGEAYASLGKDDFSFGDNENKKMRLKYLSQVPNVTMFVGGRNKKGHLKDIYGDNSIFADDDNFHQDLFKVFMGFLEASL